MSRSRSVTSPARCRGTCSISLSESRPCTIPCPINCGPCSANPVHCPCIQFSTCYLTVYLNSCALKKLASHAPDLLQCSRPYIERFLHSFSVYRRWYNKLLYTRVYHALDVLDILDVAHFYKTRKANVAFVPKYHLRHLASEGEVYRWAAIVDSLSVLSNVSLLCQIPPTLPNITEALNNSILLPRCSFPKSNALFYRDQVRLTQANSPHYSILSESLYIPNVRPVDKGTFKCVSSGECSQSKQTVLDVVGKFCILSPKAIYVFV